MERYGPVRADLMATEEYLAGALSHGYATRIIANSTDEALSIMRSQVDKYSAAWDHLGIRPKWAPGAEVQRASGLIDLRMETSLTDLREAIASPMKGMGIIAPANRLQKQRAIMAMKQREAQRGISMNGLYGGQGHTRYKARGGG